MSALENEINKVFEIGNVISQRKITSSKKELLSVVSMAAQSDEDEVNYQLNELYDLCDKMRIWIGI